ncbi:unnamed protein product [Prorocentrum cordatum]|uniref:Uncharacterized protein n=1 Tax=Prorocentrum cordatum TaxID=2364126 RepID=A0ABN9T9T0_9DINO|nr:unnamed protein product [Polarella glacialis]
MQDYDRKVSSVGSEIGGDAGGSKLDAVREKMKQDMADEVRAELQQELRPYAREELKEEMLEEVIEELRGDLKETAIRELREELEEEVRNDMKFPVSTWSGPSQRKSRASRPPRPPIPADAKPDRHFELLVPFELGSAALGAASEPALQLVAATWLLRRRLRLRLVSTPFELEHDALGAKRLHVSQEMAL